MYFVLGIQGWGFKSLHFYSIQHLSLFYIMKDIFIILKRINDVAYWYAHCTSYIRLLVQVSQILLNTILKFIFISWSIFFTTPVSCNSCMFVCLGTCSGFSYLPVVRKKFFSGCSIDRSNLVLHKLHLSCLSQKTFSKMLRSGLHSWLRST